MSAEIRRGSLALGMRITAGISQKVVVQKSGISQSRYSRFENGVIDLAEDDYARALFALGVAVGEQRRR